MSYHVWAGNLLLFGMGRSEPWLPHLNGEWKAMWFMTRARVGLWRTVSLYVCVNCGTEQQEGTLHCPQSGQAPCMCELQADRCPLGRPLVLAFTDHCLKA